jgi:hypothetical protein
MQSKETQRLGGDLGEHGGVAHPEVLGAGVDDHPAIAGRLHPGELGGRAPVVLHVHGEPEPAEPPPAPARRAPGGEAAPVRQRQRALQVLCERARGEDGAARGRPGERSGCHQIPPPELDPVDSRLARGGLDEALGQVVRLDAADPAEGRERRRVGEDAPNGHVSARDAIGAAQGRGEIVHHYPDVPAREIRAVAPIDAHAHRREPPLPVEGQFAAQPVVPGLVIAQEPFRALGGPLDRAPEPPGGGEDQRELRIDAAPGPEAAARVRYDDAQALGLDPHHVGEHRAHPVGRLAADPERPARGGRVVLRDPRPRLHEHRSDPVVDHVDAGDVGRPGEGRLDRVPVTLLPLERHVAGSIVPDQGRVRPERLLDVDGGRARLVVDPDQLGRILGLA